MTGRTFLAATPVALLVFASACARLDTKSEVDVKPIEVKPIHITVDVNVRIDRELDEFFEFEDDAATKPAAAPTTTTTTPDAGSAQ